MSGRLHEDDRAAPIRSRGAEQIRVAVVEDDPSVRTAFSRLLRGAGFDVEAFGSANELLASAAQFKCVLIDVHLGGMTGLELHATLSRLGGSMSVILISGYDTPQTEQYAREAGLPYFRKPVLARDLLAAVVRATAHA